MRLQLPKPLDYINLCDNIFCLKRLTKLSRKAKSFICRSHDRSLSFFSVNKLYKVLLILINTFREKDHSYQDYMTRFNNSSKELPVNFSKLILLQMEICLVMNGENKKTKNQVVLIFDNVFFSYFSISYYFRKESLLSNTII